MSSGHTDTATINQRRPLTENMKRTLRMVAAGDRAATVRAHWLGHVCRKDCTEAEKNAMRALIDRGMVTVLLCEWYTLTEAGRRALENDRG